MFGGGTKVVVFFFFSGDGEMGERLGFGWCWIYIGINMCVGQVEQNGGRDNLYCTIQSILYGIHASYSIPFLWQPKRYVLCDCDRVTMCDCVWLGVMRVLLTSVD